MTDDIQRFDYLRRELEDYMKTLSASTVNIEPIDEREVNPTPNLPEK
jgi:hypothetical protein